MKLDQVKRLKEFNVENAWLRKAVSDLTVDTLNRAGMSQFRRAMRR